MEKLIELLNEYAPEDFNWCAIGGKIYDKEYTENSIPVNVEMGVYIISKQFGFIEWLVDNDKIDRDKIIEKSDFMPIVSDKVGNLLNPTEEQELLMLLSISDTPIEDLISYLKIS